VIYPSASPNVIAVGGTTLNGCSGTSCAGFTS
jgi:subtilase family serine protease